MLPLVVTMILGGLPGADGLTKYETQFYVLETDLPEARAKFIGRVMDATGKEYYHRFQGFRGQVRRKPKLKVFAQREDYRAALHRAAGDEKLISTRGVFDPSDETVYTYEGSDQELEHVLKHECFHQFAHFVIGGHLPPWVNEGLAEYFADGTFEEATGRLRLGAVPAWRADFFRGFFKAAKPPTKENAPKQGASTPVKKDAENATEPPPRLLSVDQLLHMRQDDWNDHVDQRGSVQYNQAWALCHFLVHAEGGKYEPFFNDFLRHIDGGLDADTAFIRAFGPGTEDLQLKFDAHLRSLAAR